MSKFYSIPSEIKSIKFFSDAHPLTEKETTWSNEIKAKELTRDEVIEQLQSIIDRLKDTYENGFPIRYGKGVRF